MRGSFGQPSNHSAAVLGRRRASIEALANSSWDDEALPRQGSVDASVTLFLFLRDSETMPQELPGSQ